MHDTRLGQGEALISLELPRDHAADLATFRMHPALMDLATGGAQALLPGFDPAEHFYVPFSYNRVLLLAPLPARIFSHVRLRPGVAGGLAVFDVTLTDDAGRELVLITGFTMRLLADRRALSAGPLRHAAPSSTLDGQPDPASPAWSGSLREEALRAGLLPAEGLDALDRVLALRGVPQIVASSIDLARWDRRVTAEARAPLPPAISAPPRHDGPPRIAPRTALERELAGYWQELLGVRDVGVHDDFFELGGQSLIAVRLFNKIRKSRGVDLPLSTLFEAPTIARCAEILRAELGLPPSEAPASSGNSLQEPAPPPESGGAPGAALAVAPRGSRWSSLVAMQPRGTRLPFYCVAGMGGNLANLRRLATLVGEDQPFYGLQPPGLDGKQRRLYRVEELGAHYLQEILAFQPRGPFLLGGYSGGGVAAFEIGCQLARLGHTVGFLGFIDSFSPSLPRKPYLERARIHARRAAEGGPGYLLDLASRRLRYQRAQLDRRVARTLVHVFPEKYRYATIGDSWQTAERAYVPPFYEGGATLFRAEEQSALSLWTAFDVDERHGWGRLMGGTVAVERCPGNHASMCEEPHVQDLAARLRACLDRANAPVTVG